MQRGAKVSGSRFYFLTGPGALLQLGLLQLALRLAIENGFIPMIPPVLVRPEVMAGTGFLGAHADEVYRLRPTTSTWWAPRKCRWPAITPTRSWTCPADRCGTRAGLRASAARPGSYGKDTRGIIRVHQFDKVEGFVYCKPAEAEAEHERLLGWQREMLGSSRCPTG